MTIALETGEVCSLGSEPIEVLGFKSEQDLEEALAPLMQEIESGGLIAA